MCINSYGTPRRRKPEQMERASSTEFSQSIGNIQQTDNKQPEDSNTDLKQSSHNPKKQHIRKKKSTTKTALL